MSALARKVAAGGEQIPAATAINVVTRRLHTRFLGVVIDRSIDRSDDIELFDGSQSHLLPKPGRVYVVINGCSIDAIFANGPRVRGSVYWRTAGSTRTVCAVASLWTAVWTIKYRRQGDVPIGKRLIYTLVRIETRFFLFFLSSPRTCFAERFGETMFVRERGGARERERQVLACKASRCAKKSSAIHFGKNRKLYNNCEVCSSLLAVNKDTTAFRLQMAESDIYLPSGDWST